MTGFLGAGLRGGFLPVGLPLPCAGLGGLAGGLLVAGRSSRRMMRLLVRVTCPGVAVPVVPVLAGLRVMLSVLRGGVSLMVPVPVLLVRGFPPCGVVSRAV